MEREPNKYAQCLLSILDSLKLHDKGSLWNGETLSETMWRKMEAYGIDLNEELGFTHLSPVKKEESHLLGKTEGSGKIITKDGKYLGHDPETGEREFLDDPIYAIFWKVEMPTPQEAHYRNPEELKEAIFITAKKTITIERQDG